MGRVSGTELRCVVCGGEGFRNVRSAGVGTWIEFRDECDGVFWGGV